MGVGKIEGIAAAEDNEQYTLKRRVARLTRQDQSLRRWLLWSPDLASIFKHCSPVKTLWAA